MIKFCIFLLLALLCSCGYQVNSTIEVNHEPELWPDYRDVTVPKNIAPLNFSTIAFDSLDAIEAHVSTPSGEVYDLYGDQYIDFPLDMWHNILAQSAGGRIEVTVSEVKNGAKYTYKPFYINVAESEVDPYLCYRLITPGYELYSRMGLYCRNLTNFYQKTVVDNRLINANCVNCHSFCKGDPAYASFHVRGDLNSTIIRNGGDFNVCRAVTDKYRLNCVYPYWHPSGKYIAYSQNNTVQAFHCSNANRVEVYDMESRVVVYDIASNKLLTCPYLNSENTFTTEPSFSPDGKTLYYTTSKAVDMEKFTKDTHYDICKIEFDEASGKFGDRVDTIIKVSSDSMTTAFPRPSYNGKYLLYTKFDYGQFGIWHKEADLWMLDLASGDTYPLDQANSNDVESYHSWSQNSEWIVFESRRDDGLYTRAYIAHINANGRADKAFMIPQRSPEHNRNLMYSYNVPEFATEEFEIDKAILESRLKSGEKLQFQY
ncbi:MAG: hypothetical protein K6F33_05885 [Bacteroidales bacterium]|nr:hypothetical protein [Bacteroidales bacterium]